MAVTLISRAGNPFPRDRISVDSKGVPHYTNLPASLTAMLERQVRAAGSAEAVVEIGGRRLTYAELWVAASRVAGGLRSAGVAVGDRVAIRYPAGVDWVVAFFGTIMAGGIVVAVNTRSSQPEVEFVLTDAGVKVDLPGGAPLPDGEPIEPVVLGHSDVAAMFYTSGTTGKPKGVPTTHEAFLTNIENMLCGLGISADIGAELRTLISVPLFHVTGCNSQVLVALAVGGSAAILPAFDQAAAVRRSRRSGSRLWSRCRPSTRCCCGATTSKRSICRGCAGSDTAARRSLQPWCGPSRLRSALGAFSMAMG